MVDSTSEYSALMRLRLWQHRILMAAEIDCCDADVAAAAAAEQRDPSSTYLELKTYK